MRLRLVGWVEEARGLGSPGHVPGVSHQQAGEGRQQQEDEEDDEDKLDCAGDVAGECATCHMGVVCVVLGTPIRHP